VREAQDEHAGDLCKPVVLPTNVSSAAPLDFPRKQEKQAAGGHASASSIVKEQQH
jgi:hypothetical protein